MSCIVYALMCGTEKMYIGSTKRLSSRTSTHLAKLRRGYHPCAELQKDFLKFGEKLYIVTLLETGISSEKLLEREFFWIRENHQRLYNKVNKPITLRRSFKRVHPNPAMVKLRKPVEEMLEGLVVATYDSIYQCHKITGIDKADLHAHLGGRKHHHLRGRIFRFKKAI